MLALAGCGSDVSAGTVAGKEFVPARDWVYLQPNYVTTCGGKPLVCTPHLVGFIPIPMHDPACWRLTLKDGDSKGRVCVSREDYDRAALGDHYPPAKAS